MNSHTQPLRVNVIKRHILNSTPTPPPHKKQNKKNPTKQKKHGKGDETLRRKIGVNSTLHDAVTPLSDSTL